MKGVYWHLPGRKFTGSPILGHDRTMNPRQVKSKPIDRIPDQLDWLTCFMIFQRISNINWEKYNTNESKKPENEIIHYKTNQAQ